MRFKVPVLVPTVPQLKYCKRYLKRIDQNRIYSNFGPLNDELIHRLAVYFGVESQKICTTSSATAGLQGLIETSVKFSGVNSWSLPSWTFTATASALGQSNQKGRFVDIDKNWRGVFQQADDLAVLDVAPFGDSLDLDRLQERKVVIVDCAPSFDSLKNLKLDVPYPVALVLSLHATKLVPAGEGGVVISNSDDWIREFRSWSNFGFSSERNSNMLGTNAKMSEYSAAVALASLDNWPRNRKAFLELRNRTLDIAHSLGLSCSPAEEKGLATPYWILKTESETQTNLIAERLKANSIETRRWWGNGCHKMLAYEKFCHSPLPRTDLAASTYIGLPFHLSLSDDDLSSIARALEEAVK